MDSNSLLIYCPREEVASKFQDAVPNRFLPVVTTQPESMIPLLSENRFAAIIFDGRESYEQHTDSNRVWMTKVIDFLGSQQSVTPLYEIADEQAQIAPLSEIHHRLDSVDGLIVELEKLSSPIQIDDLKTIDPPANSASKSTSGFGHLETRSPEFKKMLRDLMIAGAHDVAILLIGETGSGKTYLSKLIHESSPRNREPFVHVACGALPSNLIESELFGHVKGAFTSAHADAEGKIVAARNGTILLDEIDVLGPDQQVKLLRVIETGEFELVGSNKTLTSQARMIFASNLDLEPLIEQGKFRPDLYYRLNMLKFEIPPLRKRRMDIVPLTKKFIQKFQQKHNVVVNRIDDDVLDILLNYPWPGNVRELEHVMQRAVIYCRNGTLSPGHLPPNLLNGKIGPTNDPSIRLDGANSSGRNVSLGKQVEFSEKEIIEDALSKNNFSRTNTARQLGISRVTLYNKMKKYEMLKTSQ